MSSLITHTPPAPADEAFAHFSERLRFETDCSDVYHSQQTGQVDFVLVDVRNAEAFAAGHIPGALNLPTRTLTAERLAAFPAGTLFVVYCAGPHCNGAHRAAACLAQLGHGVKEMLGGITGWCDEGFSLSTERVVSHAPTPASCAC
ncbi:rhodanese-like domain-containing protein [Pseudomonas alabamensis]|uniref:rhodanese-like domain-containing protein n=1 Tax=Pseudomonas alabamensis TaxID=3064349 RepID=UPI0021D80715|nr:rhodanese-like domain-containing protein [Pseudomonas entomophila]